MNTIRNLGLVLICGLTVLPAHAQSAFPRGLWLDQAGEVSVSIEPCAPQSATLCGVIVEDRRTETEVNPPGYRVLSDLKPRKGQWRGKFADGGISGSVTVKSRGTSQAAVRFCFAAIACETELWRRVDTGSVPAGNIP